MTPPSPTVATRFRAAARDGAVRPLVREDAVYADQFEIYHGNSNPELARKIARWLGTECGKAEVFQIGRAHV